MTDTQVQLIRSSWKNFRALDPGVVGDLFYSKLFLEHPEFRKMFPADMKEQHRKLIDMLSYIVSRLDGME